MEAKKAAEPKSTKKLSAKEVQAEAAAEAAYKVAAQKLDKAAGAGVIHKNQAANRKSGLAVAINAL